MRLPDFLGVGPGRAGTSWLYEVLRAHPEVGLAKDIKEVYFFDRNFERGLDWYASFFAHCSDEQKACGEITNRYIFEPRLLERVLAVIPGCRFIVCIRNPFERIQSVYSFRLREGGLACSFAEALRREPSLIDENRYSRLLAPYLQNVDRSRLFFLLYDDLAVDPFGVAKQVLAFLGVADSEVPALAGERVNRAIVPRHHLIGRLTKGVARGLRRAGLYGVLTAAKRSELVKRVLFRPFAYADQGLLEDPTVLEELADAFLPEVAWCSNLLYRNLDHWIPEHTGQT